LSSLASNYYRISPTINLVKEFAGSVSAVKVISGAYPGARIHWSAPTDQEFVGEDSELLVNGECYLAPNGHAERFWITWGTTTPINRADIFLRAYNCASPVIVLNSNPNKGGEAHLVKNAALSLVEVVTGEITLYTDQRGDDTGLDDEDFTIPLCRGYIGGYLTLAGAAAQAVTVTAWARVDPLLNTYWSEIARWELTAQDRTGTRYSCSLEEGGTSTYRTTATYVRNGPLLLPWPAFGLKLTIQAITGDFTDLKWSLYERTQ